MTRRERRAVALVTSAGALALAYGVVVTPGRAASSYLFAFIFVFTIVAGSLFLLMIGYATNAAWFVPLRRQCELVISAFPLLALLLVPVLVSVRRLYPWTRPEALPPFERYPVLRKLGWLDESYFAARSLAYVSILVILAECLRAWSIEQDRAESDADAARCRARCVKASVIGLLVAAPTITFAAWDWIMSLEPAWFSDLFGVYLFAGSFLSAIGLAGVMAVRAKRIGALPAAVHADHFQALGRLELAMVIFWAYMAFCHVLQHWIANLPVEQVWYVVRFSRGWRWEGLTLIVAHFVLPFFVLLSRAVKRNPRAFAAVSAWLVFVHGVDVHYLIVPALRAGPVLSWLDIAAVSTLSGASIVFAALRSRGVPAFPAKDPLLAKGLAYESAS